VILERIAGLISAHRRPFVVFGWLAAIFLGTMMGWLPGGLAVLVTLIGLHFFSRSRLLPRLRHGIRWKFLVAISVLATLFFGVSVINFAAMTYMHNSVHALEDSAAAQPERLLPGLRALHQTQHGLLFELTPVLGLLATLVAAALGLAMATLVIDPVRRMSEAMRRIAAGDLSERVAVDNRDELGELATRINHTAEELASLQAVRLAEERARAREEMLQERVAQVTMAQEEERRRIARELHDGLGPSLAAIGNRLRASRAILRTDPEQAERELAEVEQGLRAHVREIRELIYDLRPPALDQLGLTEAVRQYAERFAREAGLEATVQTEGNLSLHPLTEVTIFRVAQECLSNIYKHARAQHVEVRLERNGERITLLVADDGRGFDCAPSDAYAVATDPTLEPEPADTEGAGLGLLGMRERAELVHGELEVQSALGAGTRVTLRLPVSPVAASADAERA